MLRLLSTCIVVAAAAPTWAQPASAQAQAEATFREGRALLEKGDVAAACKAFDASYALDPTAPTLLNRANCRDLNHQLATAWGLFLEAERQTRNTNDEATKELHQVALAHSQQLAPRVSKLTISVAADGQQDGLEILRDGQRVEATLWNVALPFDGGTYTITARAPGSTEWTTRVTIGAEADTKTVDIPRLKTLASQAEGSSAAHSPLRRTAVGGTPPGHGKKILGLALGGVAVGASVVGIIAAGASNNAYDDINADANAERPFDPTKQSAAHADTAIAGAMFGVAAAAAIAGGVLYYLGVRDAHTEPTVAIAPIVSPSVFGASAGLRF